MEEFPTLKVAEIFDSVQGEGLHTGRYCTFVRLWGCNAEGRRLGCARWCDTLYAWHVETALKDKDNALYAPVSADELFGKLSSRQIPVVFTGGEPMLQLGKVWGYVHELAMDMPVAIETNGTMTVLEDNAVWVTVSPKPPSYEIAPRRVDEVKLVVGREMMVVDTLKELTEELERKCDADYRYLQPMDNERFIASWIANWLKEFPGWRLGMQLHKTLDIR